MSSRRGRGRTEDRFAVTVQSGGRMACDEAVAERIRKILAAKRGVTEKRMFGGLAFLSRGHMFVGLNGDTLMARVGPEAYEESLARPHVRVMDFTGRPLRGYVYVDPPGFRTRAALARWVESCHDHARSLPSKKAR